MKLLILLSAIFGAAIVHAGGVGNGGIAVVCRANGQIKSAQLLDYYEASVRGISIKLGAPDLSVQQKLKIMLNRIAEFDTNRADAYRQGVQQFFSQKYTRFLSHTRLAPTRDSYEQTFPDGCGPEQLIIQQPPQFPEDRLWTVSQDIWAKLDNDNRAGAVMHELMFREALNQVERPATDSRRVRYFNSYVAADLLSNMTESQYTSFIANGVQLNTVTVQGVEFFAYHSCSGRALDSFCNNAINGTVETSNGGSIDTGFDFYPKKYNGKEIAMDGHWATSIPVHIDGLTFVVGDSGIEREVGFYPNGTIKYFWDVRPGSDGWITTRTGQRLEITAVGYSGCCQSGADAVFYPNGMIKHIPIANQTLHLPGIDLPIYGYADFDQQQNVRHVGLNGTVKAVVHGRTLNIGSFVDLDVDGNILGATTSTSQSFNGQYYRLTVDGMKAWYTFDTYSSGVLKALGDAYQGAIQGQLYVSQSWHDVDLSGQFTFYPDGKPHAVAFADDVDFQIQGQDLAALHGTKMELSQNGDLLDAFIARGGVFSSHRDWFELNLGPQSARFSRVCDQYGRGCEISFYPDEKVKSGFLSGNQELKSADGSVKQYYDGNPISFDENGYAVN